jgi:hypothetical protein
LKRNTYRDFSYKIKELQLQEAINRLDEAEKDKKRLVEALRVAINTVECHSLDDFGNELPWYKMAKLAIDSAMNKEQS